MSQKVYETGLIPENHQADGNWFRYLRIQVKDKNYLKVLRVIWSKLLYTEEELTEEEEVLGFHCYEKCMEIAARDKIFHQKYFFQLWLNRVIMVDFPAFCRDKQAQFRHKEILASYYSHGRNFLHARIYFGNKGSIGSVCLKSGKPRKPKPRNRIAVGYRDKGSVRNPAEDGSPSWQEVAMSENGESEVSFSDKLLKIWCQIQNSVHPLLVPWRGKERRRSYLVLQMRG